MKTGVEIIAEERKRQIEEVGFTLDHDIQYQHGQLSTAAACYALPSTNQILSTYGLFVSMKRWMLWPLAKEWWKPSNDRIRELAKAGALIAAEIDRLNKLKQE